MSAPAFARLPALLAAFLVATVATPAGARVTDGETTSSLNTSLREWMSLHNVPAGSVAIMKDGRLISTFGVGGMQAHVPARIASLSKAITAICVAQLIDSGRLLFTTSLDSVLRRTFARLGQPADPRFRTITIEQLLMHRAGLAREPLRGPFERDMTGRFISTLATPLASDPGGDMVYSNIGYITLGMVVEAVTGSDYERYCREVALRPMNASGTIDAQLRQRASSGGWRVSAIDYARFIQVFEPGSAALGPIARQWQEARTGARSYGLGVVIARTSQGILLSHSGRNALGVSERSGSFMMKFPNGWTAVMAFAGDPRGAIADLRRRLQTAIAGL